MNCPPCAAALLASAALGACLTGCTSIATPRADLVGTSAPPGAASRVVFVSSDTRAVNVVGGEVLRFASSGNSFAWSFDVSPIVSVFALDQIAPPGMLDHRVLVYVTPDPRYSEASEVAQTVRLGDRGAWAR